MFGHPLDFIVVLLVILLLFGAKKLPALSRSIGESIQQFKKGMNEVNTPGDEKKKITEGETSTQP